MNCCAGRILILLGLFFKASGENSTKAYYLELTIEAAAYKSFTKLLGDLKVELTAKDTFTIVEHISITTECYSEQLNCKCNPQYIWSNEVCENFTQCCNQENCTFPTPNPKAMCLSANTVFVSGSFTVENEPFTSDLNNPASVKYKTFVDNYTKKLETYYSKLNWFDSLTITKLRQGSVIGDFLMIITSSFQPQELENATKLLKKENVTLELVVTGLVTITKTPATESILDYNAKASLTCSTNGNLGKPTWFFQQNTLMQAKEITTGTESRVTSTDKYTTVEITNATEVWKGTFTCLYMSLEPIIYKASQYLDIALLPTIFLTSDPQFPDCTGNKKSFSIKVQCIVPYGGENYTVKWDDKKVFPENQPVLDNDEISYQAYTTIYCDEKQPNISVDCTLTNRKHQSAKTSETIGIINEKDKTCPEEDKWPLAKAGFTAKIFCDSGTVGKKTRMCSDDGTWKNVVSECVNRDLSVLLNDAKDLKRGLGIVEKMAFNIFHRLSQSTQNESVNSFANIDASVGILKSMFEASGSQNSSWTSSVFPDFVKSSSNLLNDSLDDSWKAHQGNDSLAYNYLTALEGILHQTNLTAKNDNLSSFIEDNLHVIIHDKSDSNSQRNNLFNVSATWQGASPNMFVQAAIKNLASKLPNTFKNNTTVSSKVILSVIANKGAPIKINFNTNRQRHHHMYCVFWDNITKSWSDINCTWGGADNPNQCKCNHLSAFTILMSKDPINLLYMEELTIAGLGFSIGSLALCLIIEFLVWNAVVKSNIAHFRHTVLVNIMVSLLIADCSFLAAPTPSSSPSNWCLTLTVMKHFCYLAVFFWMMCLSLGLLHQVIFVFVHLRKKVYLGLCFFLGYVCPFIIVVVTFISNNNGANGSYYSPESCWLIYEEGLKGSIHAFLFPVFVIVFVNMFTMAVVISRILKPTLSEGSSHDEKEVARSIVKTVVLLTPTLGITWILGLFVLMLDLTKQPYAQIVNYAFTFFNSFQGFFILLTGCFGEKKVRDALLKRLRPRQSVNYKSESTTRMSSMTKQK